MLKIIIVEDEDIIRKGLVFTIDWLSIDCVVVAEATNGEEGLQYVNFKSIILTSYAESLRK